MAVDLSNITGTRLPVGASIKFPDGRSWTRETDNGDLDWSCRFVDPTKLSGSGTYETRGISDREVARELLCVITYSEPEVSSAMDPGRVGR